MLSSESSPHTRVAPDPMKAPFAYAQVTLPKADYIELKAQAKQWRTQWQRTRTREEEAFARIKQIKAEHANEIAVFQEQISTLNNQLAGMQHRVFGHSTEKKHSSLKQEKKARPSSKPRGQQRGHTGHGRTTITTLPVVPEHLDLEEHQKHCPHCRLPFKPFGTEDSDVVEVDVQAHIRRYHRHRYLKTCQCEQSPAITIAPGPAKLIRKGKLSISVWVEILLHKYAFGIPVARQLQDFRLRGLTLSPGTVPGGLKIIQPLFEPIAEAIREQVASDEQWHADETRWLVCGDEKGAKKHWLWVFLSSTAAYYRVDDNRSASVPKGLLCDSNGVLICDRYSAYKCLARENQEVFLAFCWSHVRRDFINAERGTDGLKTWSAIWVKRIGRLYHLNHQRLNNLNTCEVFQKHDSALKNHLTSMEKWRIEELNPNHFESRDY